MVSSIYLFVESEGIKLPDGTVWGGGYELKYQITRSESRPDMFKIYEYIGTHRVAKFNSDNLEYKQMREFVHGEARYYETAGMNVWAANHSEWEKATSKTLVTEEW